MHKTHTGVLFSAGIEYAWTCKHLVSLHRWFSKGLSHKMKKAKYISLNQTVIQSRLDSREIDGSRGILQKHRMPPSEEPLVVVVNISMVDAKLSTGVYMDSNMVSFCSHIVHILIHATPGMCQKFQGAYHNNRYSWSPSSTDLLEIIPHHTSIACYLDLNSIHADE